MRLEFIFDTVCPWCYVGKRRLERALAGRQGARVEIIWRPFILNPDIPPGGIDRQLYLDRKFGSPSRVQRVQSAVSQAAQSEGIIFNFDAIHRAPNTVDSHRLIRFAASLGRESQVVEALYRAYFYEGRDIGDIWVLSAIGAVCGLPQTELTDYLLSDTDVAQVMNENARSHRLGVNGVPCVVLNGLYALAGAQEPDILLRLLDIARENEAEAAFS